MQKHRLPGAVKSSSLGLVIDAGRFFATSEDKQLILKRMNEDSSAIDRLAALLGGLNGAKQEEKEPAEDEEPSPFTQQLAVAFEGLVQDLVKDEAIEVVAGQEPELAMGMAMDASAANSPKHMIKRVIHSLFNNDAVEDIFVSDIELTDRIKRALG